MKIKIVKKATNMKPSAYCGTVRRRSANEQEVAAMRRARGRYAAPGAASRDSSSLLAACGSGAGSRRQPTRTVDCCAVGVGQVASEPGPGSAAGRPEPDPRRLLATLTDDGRPRPSLAEGLDGQRRRPVAHGQSRAGRDVPRRLAAHGAVVAQRASRDAAATPWDRRSRTSTASRRLDDSRSSSASTAVAVPAGLARISDPEARLSAGRHRAHSRSPIRSRRPSCVRTTHYCTRAARRSTGSSLQTFPSVRAAWAELLRGQLDMLNEVGIDALDSLETSTSVSVFTSHAPLSVHRRPQQPGRRCFESPGRPAGA